jgi:hypothetical protein
MAENHKPLEQAFRTGRAHKIFTNNFEERGARHAGNVGGLSKSQNHGRPNDQLEVRPRVFPDMDDGQWRLIVKPEQQGQHDEHAEPETWDGQKENGHHTRSSVHEAIRPQRADHPHRQPHEPGDKYCQEAYFRTQRPAA